MSGIPDEVCIAAIETILKPLGTSLKHYEVRHKLATIEAMRAVLTAERNGVLDVVEEVRASPQWSGQHADWICCAIKDWVEEGR